jgi:hypothetical protein
MVRLALTLLSGVLIGAPVPSPPAVAVSVTSSGQNAAVYRVEVRNDAPDATDVVVRQSVPPGVAVTATDPPATVTDAEITWRVPLGGGRTRSMSATFLPDGDVARRQPGVLAGAACAYPDAEAAPAACAAATWRASGPVATSPPWWRHWLLPLAFAFVALGVLAVILRRRAGPAPEPERPRDRPPRRGPPAWTVFALALMLLVGGGTAVATATVPRLAAIAGVQPTSEDGWIGAVPTGGVGEELRENAFAFTAYRIACSVGRPSRCTADVGVHNPTAAADRWYPSMQRVRYGDDFVAVDEAATLESNGRDVFAEPLGPGEHRLARLSFVLPNRARGDVLELRSGAFAGGVRVDF